MSPTPRKSRKAEQLTDPHSVDVGRAINAMAPEHIQCRDYGHNWQPSNAAWLASEQCYRVDLRCSRCSTIRTRLLNRRGAQLESHYDYPDGYAVKGIGRLTGTDRDQIRLKSVLGLIDTTSRKRDTA